MPDLFKASLYWFCAIVVLLVCGFFYFEKSLDSDMAVFIGVLSAVVVVYSAKKKQAAKLTADKKRLLIALGLLIALFSFANQILSFLGIQMHFWNPPYSIGEYTVLLSGLSVAYFAYLDYAQLIVPAVFPAFVIFVYQLYEIYQRNVDWVAAPLVAPATSLSVFVLNLIGIKAAWSADYVISFVARDGFPTSIQIVADCSGIWSLSAFTASVLLVSFAFPKIYSKNGAAYVAVGYLGTYAANILRIVAICVSTYYDRTSGWVPATHMNAGWIAFSGWMLIFWYFFFSGYLLKKDKTDEKKS